MIIQIIKIYLSLILSIGITSIFIFITGLYFILRKPSGEKKIKNPTTKESNHLHDLTLIAGEDVITTQLDLARAYIETGKNQLAKSILEYVVAQGNAVQQNEAQQLMTHLTLCESH
jgi:FimV-like protein